MKRHMRGKLRQQCKDRRQLRYIQAQMWGSRGTGGRRDPGQSPVGLLHSPPLFVNWVSYISVITDFYFILFPVLSGLVVSNRVATHFVFSLPCPSTFDWGTFDCFVSSKARNVPYKSDSKLRAHSAYRIVGFYSFPGLNVAWHITVLIIWIKKFFLPVFGTWELAAHSCCARNHPDACSRLADTQQLP
jgi:hypothetical protein